MTLCLKIRAKSRLLRCFSLNLRRTPLNWQLPPSIRRGGRERTASNREGREGREGKRGKGGQEGRKGREGREERDGRKGKGWKGMGWEGKGREGREPITWSQIRLDTEVGQ